MRVLRAAALCASFLIVVACNRVEKARERLASGDVRGAHDLVDDHLAANKDDHEARLLFGQILLRSGRIPAANREFKQIEKIDGMRAAIARVHREEMLFARDAPNDIHANYYARTAAKYDPSQADEICTELLGIADRRRQARREFSFIVAAATELGEECRTKTVEGLHDGLTNAKDEKDVALLAGAAGRMDHGSKLELAATLRADAASAGQQEDLERARELSAAAELIVPSAREKVAETVASADTDAAAVKELYRSEWPPEVTRRVLHYLGGAVASFHSQVGAYPNANDMQSLRAQLVPTYVRDMPWSDGWGTQISYVFDGQGNARLISAGSDRSVSSESTNIYARIRGEVGEGVDFIWHNGRIIQDPERRVAQ